MAPALATDLHSQGPRTNETVSKAIFPDGIKTSGQHPPLYEELRAYEQFPTEVVGPTVWDADDYKDNPERWTHRLAEHEIEELSKAADSFRAAAIPLTGISKVSIPCKLSSIVGC